ETVAADGRVQAWVIGSGTDATERDAEETAALRGILSGNVPVVTDAGALDLAPAASAPVIVTPHARELARLRAALGLDPEAAEDDDARERAAA
ncbi:NAD(P)H-hydrate dehydratase, partial [Pseudomonas aeruginosa]